MNSHIPSTNNLSLANLGLGLGLRHVHFQHILDHSPPVDWFEIISENFMFSYGKPRYILNQIAENYPVVMHGVSLSIGSTDPINKDYLTQLKTLASEVKPAWISDHLCWTGVLGTNTHDLLPLPLHEESLKHVADRIHYVQEFLGRPLILENPSTYLRFNNSNIPEAEFFNLLVQQTGCGILLDVNNTYVTCFNSGEDPVAYIHALPHESIVQVHIAGHQHKGTHIIDTHDRAVTDAVWKLYHLAWKKTKGVATLLEWDSNIPDFDICLNELHKAKHFMETDAEFHDPSTMVTLQENISTPVDFLISPMLEEQRSEK